jgi:hypothetical protein
MSPCHPFLLGIHHFTHVSKVIPLDRRDENFRKKCPTKAMLQKKEVSQFVTYGSLMGHFSFSSMITYDTFKQKKINITPRVVSIKVCFSFLSLKLFI